MGGMQVGGHALLGALAGDGHLGGRGCALSWHKKKKKTGGGTREGGVRVGGTRVGGSQHLLSPLSALYV